ncbi:retinoschisin-like [Argopecten irradians]|uniref:retinoschisin-like n=1 Tax=Argopecten irradians TaxID=31199 RepID=UPI00371F8AA6
MKVVLQVLGFLCTANLCSADCDPCDYDLVTGPYGVSDEAFSASSTHYTCPIQYIRFTSSRSWCSAHGGVGHYIQVEFKTRSTLTAIQTLGRANYNQWITSYNANISIDGINWSSILSNGDVKVFPGNSDSNTIVTNTLERTVDAKFIRIISVTNHVHSSMRLEVKGCPIGNMSSTCNKWKATRGSTGDMFPVLEETNAANNGLCGMMCYRKPDCDSFIFNIGSNHCRLLQSTPDALYTTVNLTNVWYFIKS